MRAPPSRRRRPEQAPFDWIAALNDRSLTLACRPMVEAQTRAPFLMQACASLPERGGGHDPARSRAEPEGCQSRPSRRWAHAGAGRRPSRTNHPHQASCPADLAEDPAGSGMAADAGGPSRRPSGHRIAAHDRGSRDGPCRMPAQSRPAPCHEGARHRAGAHGIRSGLCLAGPAAHAPDRPSQRSTAPSSSRSSAPPTTGSSSAPSSTGPSISASPPRPNGSTTRRRPGCSPPGAWIISRERCSASRRRFVQPSALQQMLKRARG